MYLPAGMPVDKDEKEQTVLLSLPPQLLSEIFLFIPSRDLWAVHRSCRVLRNLVRDERCVTLTFRAPHPSQRPGALPQLLNFPRVSTLYLNSVQPTVLPTGRRLAIPGAAAAAAAAAAVAAAAAAAPAAQAAPAASETDGGFPQHTALGATDIAAQIASDSPTSPTSPSRNQSAVATTGRKDRGEGPSALHEGLLRTWVKQNRRELARQIVTLDLKQWNPELSAAVFEVLVTSCKRLQVLHANHVTQGGAFQEASISLAQQQQNFPQGQAQTTAVTTSGGGSISSSMVMDAIDRSKGARPSNLHSLSSCREIRSYTVGTNCSVSPIYLTQLATSWPLLAYLSLSRSQGVTLSMLRPLLALASSLVSLRLGWLEDEEDGQTDVAEDGGALAVALPPAQPDVQQAAAAGSTAAVVVAAQPIATASASVECSMLTGDAASEPATTLACASSSEDISVGNSPVTVAVKSAKATCFPEHMSSLRFLALEETEVTVQLARRIRGMTSLHTLHVAGGYIPKQALEILCCPPLSRPISPMFANLSLSSPPPQRELSNFPHSSNLSAIFLDSLDVTDTTWCMLANLDRLKVLQLGRLVLSSNSCRTSSSVRQDRDPPPPSLFDNAPRPLPSLNAVEAFAVNHRLSLPEGALCGLLPALLCCRVEEGADAAALMGHPSLQHFQVRQLKVQLGDSVPSRSNSNPLHDTGNSGSSSTGNAGAAPAAVQAGMQATHASISLSGWSLLLSHLSSIPNLISLSISATHLDSSPHHLPHHPASPVASTQAPSPTPAPSSPTVNPTSHDTALSSASTSTKETPSHSAAQSAAAASTYETQYAPPLLPSLLWLHLCVRGHMQDPSFGALLSHCPLLQQLQLQLREPGARVDGWSAAVCTHPSLRRVALMWMRLHVSSVETLLASGRLAALHMAACAFDYAAYRQVLSAVPGAARTSLTWETGYDVWEPPHPAFFPNPKTVQSHVSEAAGLAVRYGPYDM